MPEKPRPALLPSHRFPHRLGDDNFYSSPAWYPAAGFGPKFVRQLLLPDGLILADLVRDSRPHLGAEKVDHRFQNAPDDDECTQDADGQIDCADDPIEERHIHVPPPLTTRE
ncbi:hypothetical protein [Candidatus Methylomirabilis sp.]|uniref:hypothetical protein n=1 Tax=Candidatus Methylomirabilis sp. TaxID=2032687 RepID=UPI003C71DE33